ncbi:MAG: hypothetical protein GF355_00255 [Candidatus Eisenbacteria bacterium]|nr:hypothetical protein [Candidatus Eisenbacteria bacterium]
MPKGAPLVSIPLVVGIAIVAGTVALGDPVDEAPNAAAPAAASEPVLDTPERVVLKDPLEMFPGLQPYIYESFGRRDPFSPLLAVGEDDGSASSLPDPRRLSLMGVLWGDDDRFALLEDPNGRSFVLREGDPVWHGHVTHIEPRRVVIRYNHFGMWKTINLPLLVGKETSHDHER